jgi:hypothetical protein
MSLRAILHTKTPPVCLPLHCLVVPNGREIGLQRDGVPERAGDGTRTRDSLLGRQMVTGSPIASYKLALGERSYIFTVIHAHLRQIVARMLRQMVMDQMHWKEYTPQPLERQERQMVNHPGTKRCPSLSCLLTAFGKPSKSR